MPFAHPLSLSPSLRTVSWGSLADGCTCLFSAGAALCNPGSSESFARRPWLTPKSLRSRRTSSAPSPTSTPTSRRLRRSSCRCRCSPRPSATAGSWLAGLGCQTVVPQKGNKRRIIGHNASLIFTQNRCLHSVINNFLQGTTTACQRPECGNASPFPASGLDRTAPKASENCPEQKRTAKPCGAHQADL